MMIEADLTTDEVAALLRLHRVTVQRWLKSGRLRGYQVGRSWPIPRAALEELQQSGPLTRCPRLPSPPVPDQPGSVDGYAEWEKTLLAEDDPAVVVPAPAEALRRESLY